MNHMVFQGFPWLIPESLFPTYRRGKFLAETQSGRRSKAFGRRRAGRLQHEHGSGGAPSGQLALGAPMDGGQRMGELFRRLQVCRFWAYSKGGRDFCEVNFGKSGHLPFLALLKHMELLFLPVALALAQIGSGVTPGVRVPEGFQRLLGIPPGLIFWVSPFCRIFTEATEKTTPFWTRVRFFRRWQPFFGLEVVAFWGHFTLKLEDPPRFRRSPSLRHSTYAAGTL